MFSIPDDMEIAMDSVQLGTTRPTPLNGMPVSLVSGANKGIGLETVRRLIGAGQRVYLAARDAERGRTAAEAVGARFVQLDVTSDDSGRRAAEPPPPPPRRA